MRRGLPSGPPASLPPHRLPGDPSASPRCCWSHSSPLRPRRAGTCGAASPVPLLVPLWAERETPSPHSRLFLAGSRSPPPLHPRRGGAERPEEVGSRGDSGVSARSRLDLRGRWNSCRILSSQRCSPHGPAPAGEGRGGAGGEGERAAAGRGGERAPAATTAAAVLIPAAQRSSGRGASQMACPALGLEALQPLQPEPPPEPAFSEAQKWIEVGALGGGWAAWQGLREPPIPAPPHAEDRSSLASPPRSLSSARCLGRPPGPRASCDSPGTSAPASRGAGGRARGTLRSGCACGGQAAVPCGSIPPAGQPPAAQISAPAASRRCGGSTRRAEAPQRRRERESPESLRMPHFGGPSASCLPPVGPPPCLSGAALAASPRKCTHRSLWLFLAPGQA